MGLFSYLWSSRDSGNNKINESVDNETEKKIEYKPTGLTIGQKGFIVGSAALGCLSVSYILDYLVYMAFGTVCVCVATYDNTNLVRFINERGFLSKEIITRMNNYTEKLAVYLTPAQVSASVSETVSDTVKHSNRMRILADWGLVRLDENEKQVK